MDDTQIAKYGYSKSARYFVKSLDDLIDVVETVFKRVNQQVDNSQLIEVLRNIECKAAAIPRTLSSHILSFEIPILILESDNRPTNVSGKLPELRPTKENLPRIIHDSGRTLVTKEIAVLYDLVVFERFLRLLMSQNSDGVKMFTNKRSAEIRTEIRAEGKPGYQITVSFPGTVFKNPVVPAL